MGRARPLLNSRSSARCWRYDQLAAARKTGLVFPSQSASIGGRQTHFRTLCIRQMVVTIGYSIGHRLTSDTLEWSILTISIENGTHDAICVFAECFSVVREDGRNGVSWNSTNALFDRFSCLSNDTS